MAETPKNKKRDARQVLEDSLKDIAQAESMVLMYLGEETLHLLKKGQAVTTASLLAHCQRELADDSQKPGRLYALQALQKLLASLEA